jgi:hypothetical protein
MRPVYAFLLMACFVYGVIAAPPPLMTPQHGECLTTANTSLRRVPHYDENLPENHHAYHTNQALLHFVSHDQFLAIADHLDATANQRADPTLNYLHASQLRDDAEDQLAALHNHLPHVDLSAQHTNPADQRRHQALRYRYNAYEISTHDFSVPHPKHSRITAQGQHQAASQYRQLAYAEIIKLNNYIASHPA